jgi:NADPH-dependent 2,4-dienoyl-CoA reductase/sulfur reductase-like enzyme
MESYDVAVLGPEAARLAAAHVAAEHGARVDLFEKGERIGAQAQGRPLATTAQEV